MLKQVLSLTVGSSLGKLTGVGREILFAAFYGTSAVADGYRVALGVTISSIHLFTSEVFHAFFIPHYKRYRTQGKVEAWTLLNSLGGLVLLASLMLAITLHFGAEFVVRIVAPGFDSDRLKQAVQMLQVMAWGAPCYVLSVILVNVEAANGFFRLASLRPLVQNVGVIVAMLLGYLFGNPVWIAWGFTGTYVLFSVLGLGRILAKRLLDTGWYRHFGSLRVLWRGLWVSMKPLLLFSIIFQGNVLLEKLFASLVGPGALAAIDYARIIPETLQVLLVMPLGFVSLSSSVELSEDETHERCDKLTSVILLAALPVSCFIFFASTDIVAIIYARGAFGEESVHLTASALRGMSVGLWAVGIGYVLQKVFNARLMNNYVLRVGVVAVTVNICFNLLTYKLLGVLGIGLGFSLGAMVMAFLYVRALGRMQLTSSIAKICALGTFFYVIAAVAFLHPGVGGAAEKFFLHLGVAIPYWLIVYGLFPSSRQFGLYYLRKIWQ